MRYFIIWLFLFSAYCSSTQIFWSGDITEEKELEVLYFIYKTTLQGKHYSEFEHSKMGKYWMGESSPLPIEVMESNFDTIVANAIVEPSYKYAPSLFLKSHFPVSKSRYRYKHNFNVKMIDHHIKNSKGDTMQLRGSGQGGRSEYLKDKWRRENIGHQIVFFGYEELDTTETYSGTIDFEISYIVDYGVTSIDSTKNGKHIEIRDRYYSVVNIDDGMVVFDNSFSDSIHIRHDLKYIAHSPERGYIMDRHIFKEKEINSADSIRFSNLWGQLREMENEDIESRVNFYLNHYSDLNSNNSSQSFQIPELIYHKIMNDINYSFSEFKEDIQKEGNKYFVHRYNLPSKYITILIPNYHKRKFTIKL